MYDLRISEEMFWEITPRMFSALCVRRALERDFHAILAGQIASLIACLGGVKNPVMEDYVVTRQKETDENELESWFK